MHVEKDFLAFFPTRPEGAHTPRNKTFRPSFSQAFECACP